MNRTTGSIDKNSNVRVELLEWSGFLSGPSSPPQLWDVIIGSDCLFFKDYHDALVKLLDSLLAVHGVAIFFQPSRSGTMELFLSKLPSTFSVEVVENYSQEVIDKRYILNCDLLDQHLLLF